MSADVTNAEGLEMQRRVLTRLRELIQHKVAALDEALLDMEDDIAEEMGAQQQADASKWRQARERRNTALEALDQHAMTGALPEDRGRRRIAAMAEALRTLKAQHDEMKALEAQLAPSSRRGSSEGTRAGEYHHRQCRGGELRPIQTPDFASMVRHVDDQHDRHL